MIRIFIPTYRLVLGPTQPSILWKRGFLIRVNRSGLGFDLSPPSSAMLRMSRVMHASSHTTDVHGVHNDPLPPNS